MRRSLFSFDKEENDKYYMAFTPQPNQTPKGDSSLHHHLQKKSGMWFIQMRSKYVRVIGYIPY